jgi:glycoprotein-N-acetylgalactosamine 3-beta-galactosyltransferase
MRNCRKVSLTIMIMGMVSMATNLYLHDSAVAPARDFGYKMVVVSQSACLSVATQPPHPHQGARDEQGCFGYIHDTKYVQSHPLDFTYSPSKLEGGVCDIPFGKGLEGRRGTKGLQKIRIAPPANKTVLCIVYTHSNRHVILQSIVETWGRRCDGFLASSNRTEVRLGAVDISHIGNESYGAMWQKVRSTWAYVYDNYINDYDFFHMGGDDMFVIAENLRNAVKDYPSDGEPIYLGGAMMRYPRRFRRFCGGGSGYTLNRAALRVLVADRFAMPECKPNDIRSDEDVMVSDCLRSVVNCTHSVDDKDESRYHPYHAHFHATWTYPDPANWYPAELLVQGITATMKGGLESISETTVSFHLVKTNIHNAPETNFWDRGMRRYHAILFGLCPYLSIANVNPFQL